MRLLLDTQVFLWAVTDSRKLKRPARDLILKADEVFVSAVSIWEVATKAKLGKLQGDPALLAEAIPGSGYLELPITAQHAAAVSQLADHHQDPFDRLLLAQAVSHPLHLLTADRLLAQYTDLVRLA